MLPPPRLTTTAKAAAITTLLLLALSACKTSPPPPAKPKPPPKVAYSKEHDAEIKEILDLARENKWELAQAKAAVLYQSDPKSPIIERVHSWVEQQAQQHRAQNLEDKIREIDAKNSVFNPTVQGLLTEQKDRGLPARKDVRNAVDMIENTPYVPDSYGKTVHEQGPLFDFESIKGRMSKVLEKEVSIHLDNVPLETILINLAQSAGINIVADKSLAPLKQVLSVNLEKVKLNEFLRYVARNYELQFQVGDQLVWVVDAKDPKRLMEETRFYRLRKGFVLPAQFGSENVNRAVVTANNVTTVTETTQVRKFVNDETPTNPSLERAITNLFMGSKWFIDYEHNLVVARGTAEQLDVMEQIIKEFDQPIQQVLIEARFLTISKPAFMQLGVLWETGRSPTADTRTPTDFTGMANSQVAPGLGIGILESFTNIFTNVLGANDLSATITALEQSGESQTISAPRLTVLNNRPATINDGKVQYYYEEYAVKQGVVGASVGNVLSTSSLVPSGKPTKITAGAELNVMASISGDGRSILLALNPRVNTDVEVTTYTKVTDAGGGSLEIKLPTYRTQELSTRMTVKSGDTVVMGGVLERARSTYVESVPILGDIPILGVLFRRRTEQDIPRYLLIFVTATIVKDTGEFLVYDTNTQTNGYTPASFSPSSHPTEAAPQSALPAVATTPPTAGANTNTNPVPPIVTNTTVSAAASTNAPPPASAPAVAAGNPGPASTTNAPPPVATSSPTPPPVSTNAPPPATTTNAAAPPK